MEDFGREGVTAGLSEGKKLDLLLRGDGDGGIWESVSIVRSDSEGLGRRRASFSLMDSFSRAPTSPLDSIVPNSTAPLPVLGLSALSSTGGLSSIETWLMSRPRSFGSVMTSRAVLGRAAIDRTLYLVGILGNGGSNAD